MSQDPYRAPGAPLIRSDAPLEPRSAVVAVVLGCLITLPLTVVLSVGLRALGLSSEEIFRGPMAFVLSSCTGFLTGWIAARYRRGPWLGVTFAVVALDLLLSGGTHALGAPGLAGPLLGALQLAVSVAGDIAGGYTGRGWRTAAARPQ